MGLTAGTLNVTGDSLLNGNVTAGALNVTGTSNLQMGMTGGSLFVSGQSILQTGLTGGCLFITGQSILNGTVTTGALNVTGQSILETGLTGGCLFITGQSILNGTVTAGALDVTGQSILEMGMTGGCLYITGDSIMNGNVTAGALYITGSSVLYGGVTTGSIYATGDTILQYVTAGNMMINGRDVTPSAGDICKELTFYAANNQSIPQDVTDFVFDNSNVRSFDAMVSVYINVNVGSNLYANFNLKGIQKNGYWSLNSTFIGDPTGITFSINTTGQIQYTSTNISDFNSDIMKFRALTTSVVS